MALVLRGEKGAKLTSAELDGNFTYLKGLIDALGSGSSTLPVFTSRLAPQNKLVGQTLTIPASVTGASTYQWYKNGAIVSGATAATFTKANAQVGDTGKYFLVASNSVGGVRTFWTSVDVVPVFQNDASLAVRCNYDFTDATSVVATGGELVSCTDKGDFGFNLGTTAGSRPLYVTDAGGNYASFNSADKRASASGFTNQNDEKGGNRDTLFMVIKQTGFINNAFIAQTYNNGGDGGIIVSNDQGPQVIASARRANKAGRNAGAESRAKDTFSNEWMLICIDSQFTGNGGMSMPAISVNKSPFMPVEWNLGGDTEGMLTLVLGGQLFDIKEFRFLSKSDTTGLITSAAIRNIKTELMAKHNIVDREWQVGNGDSITYGSNTTFAPSDFITLGAIRKFADLTNRISINQGLGGYKMDDSLVEPNLNGGQGAYGEWLATIRAGDTFSVNGYSFFSYGTNNDMVADTLNRATTSEINSYRTRVATHIQRQITFGLDPKRIVLWSPPYNPDSRPFLQDVRDVYQYVAAQLGVTFIDVYQYVKDNNLPLTDGTHPGAPTYLAIANYWITELAKVEKGIPV